MSLITISESYEYVPDRSDGGLMICNILVLYSKQSVGKFNIMIFLSKNIKFIGTNIFVKYIKLRKGALKIDTRRLRDSRATS